MQLDDPDRGFSYLHDTPLDMRMDRDVSVSAYDVINTFKEADIANIFYNYAEERLSRQIAQRIIEQRPVETSKQLADLVKEVYWRKYHKHSKAHPATKVFQALRICVNKELEVLETLLESLPEVLADGATVAILSFHSLEDRIVKQFFKKANDKYKFELSFKKPLIATDEELKENSRSRSAKLRAARFILK
jgi:16S rRNA (cytosine1402-N4)-methyltransferase